MQIFQFLYHFFYDLIHCNWYSIRRRELWPEASYKRGMLKRLQKAYKLTYFVETGTYKGDTPRILSNLF